MRDRYGRHTHGPGRPAGAPAGRGGRAVRLGLLAHATSSGESWDTHNRHDELSRRTSAAARRPELQRLAGRPGTCAACWTRRWWCGWASSAARRGMGVNFSNNTNNVGGRDHWCNCYSVVLAGGGVRGGQVVGSSDWIGGYPKRAAGPHQRPGRDHLSTPWASIRGRRSTTSRASRTTSATAIPCWKRFERRPIFAGPRNFSARHRSNRKRGRSVPGPHPHGPSGVTLCDREDFNDA